MSLELYLSERRIDNIADEQEFMEREHETVWDYCEERNFILSPGDLQTVKNRGLEESLDYWKNEFKKETDTATELYTFLRDFMILEDWDVGNTPKQARAVFTTICLTEDIEADTGKCDDMLTELYSVSGLEKTGMGYEDFTNFMLELIV